MTAAGYEFRPQALGDTIRWAHRAIGKPIYVTESGIATEDDARRIAFIRRSTACAHASMKALLCTATCTGPCWTTSSGLQATVSTSVWSPWT